MRKKSFITFNYDKTKKNIYNGINNWNDTQGWILIIFVPIFVIISIIEKWAPITIILNSFYLRNFILGVPSLIKSNKKVTLYFILGRAIRSNLL